MTDFFVGSISDQILFFVCLFLLGSSIYITFKTRFIQIRLLPFVVKSLKGSFSKPSVQESEKHTISPYKALFTAMSTTIGISSIVGPVIAIQLGGPGALLGFVLTAFFGSAATYLEVHLSVKYRQTLPSGEVMGGPMHYLAHIFSSKMAKWYALCCMVLMTVWSAAQANQLAAILSSPSLGKFRIDPLYSGIGIAFLVGIALLGGIRRIGALSAKIVPAMFIFYLGTSFWIIGSNLDQLGRIFHEMFSSVFSPYALASGSLVGGVVSAFRWGVFKGVNATEAGLGTQTIPHSFAKTSDPQSQGALAMVSTFSSGALTFLSGCVALITQTWQDPSIPMGISVVTASYEHYFSVFGVLAVTFIAILFGFGTILGNSFNGTQCYNYLMKNKNRYYYLSLMLVMVFLGCLGEVRFVWSFVDIVLCFMAVPHMMALLLSLKKEKSFVLIK